MKRKLILAAVFLGGLILILVWMQGGFHSKVPGGLTSAPEKTAPSPRTLKVEKGRSGGEVTVSGSVVSRETAKVAARVQGYVIEINADAGNQVKKGQVLLRIDVREMAERAAQAQAALESAQADLVKAEKDYERFEKLFEKESIAKKQLDDAKAQLDVARAAKQRTEAALQEAKTLLAYGTVVAPFDGTVAERYVNMGDLVTPGRPLFSIYMPGTAEMVAPAGEQYAPFLQPGTSVIVRIPSVGLEDKSRIREVIPQRDEKSRTITVKAPLPQVPGLAPGLYGTLTFDTQLTETIIVPASAVKTVGQLETVRVLDEGKIMVRQVKTGRKLDGNLEIISGLNPGETLVLD
jgi:RND family efflux transporter MFP subunit